MGEPVVVRGGGDGEGAEPLMAKISARGDRERLRWTRAHGTDVLVLTEQGRLLQRLGRDGTYTVRRPRGAKTWSPATAGAQAAMLGYTTATPRI